MPKATKKDRCVSAVKKQGKSESSAYAICTASMGKTKKKKKQSMTYQYRCNKCNKEISIVKPISESNNREFCDYCDKELKRVFVAPSVITGDGFKN